MIKSNYTLNSNIPIQTAVKTNTNSKITANYNADKKDSPTTELKKCMPETLAIMMGVKKKVPLAIDKVYSLESLNDLNKSIGQLGTLVDAKYTKDKYYEFNYKYDDIMTDQSEIMARVSEEIKTDKDMDDFMELGLKQQEIFHILDNTEWRAMYTGMIPNENGERVNEYGRPRKQ